MQLYSRIVVNLLVIVKILVNLLVKLTNIKVRGAMGLWVRGIHSGEARTLGVRTNRPWANPPQRLIVLPEDYWDYW